VVAILFGGRSSEHAISCVSAAGVLSAIDRYKYDVIAVGITKAGAWYAFDGEPDSLRIHDGVLPEVKATGTQVRMSLDPSIRGFVAVDGSELPQAFRQVDVVFPVMHGPYGEDGTIQGALEFADVACVGSGVFASAAAMDKAHMKAMFAANRLPIGPFEVITNTQWINAKDESLARIAKLGLPVFVKPTRAGSSLGVIKVKSADALAAAIDEARTHDPKVIVEAAIENAREIECGVLVRDGIPQTSVTAEIIVHGQHEFYDFEAKYLEDSADLVVPADLPKDVESEVQALAIKAFEALDCEGFARCDFFVRENGEVILNEVNTLPGFTPISMFPRMWQASGLSYAEIIDTLIVDALRHGTGLR
jgi:D-alanine-D-alanine ligase